MGPALQVGSGANGCPSTNPYVAVGGGSNTNGGTCTLDGNNRPTQLNSLKLQDSLTVFAEPTDALVNSWFKGYVYELKFTQPQFGVYGTSTFATGTIGDIVVLQKGDCTGVSTVTPASYTIGSTHSAKMVLEEYGGETEGDEKGGVAQVKSIAD